jgi:hypothetical protein
MQVLVAFFVAATVNVLLISVMRRRYEPEVFRVVALAYVGTLILRYSLAIFLWMNHTDSGFTQAFWGDSQTYDYFGASVAESWSHGTSTNLWAETMEGRVNKGFIYFVACVYYVFGRNVLLMQFINGIIGALTPLVIFEIGLLLYSRRVATTAMLLTAFFPQMIFWSSALYKDPAVMLCIAANILCVFRLRRRLDPFWILVYLATAGALVWLRFYIFYAVLAAALAGLLVGHRRGAMVGLLTQLLLVTGVILLLLFTPLGQEVLLRSQFLDLDMLQNSRLDLAERGDSGFSIDADVSTVGGLLKMLPVGVTYLLFAPFPWTVSSVRQLLALPDVLAWYALTPALVAGIGLALKRLRQTMPILVFTTALTLAYGAFLGNVGTAYRQRTQVMMFYFLFVADGIHRKRHHARVSDEAPQSQSGVRALAPAPAPR